MAKGKLEDLRNVIKKLNYDNDIMRETLRCKEQTISILYRIITARDEN